MGHGRLVLVALCTAFALAAPANAQAHLRTGRVATDFRADVSPLRPQLSDTLAVRIYTSDLAVRLSGRSRHEIVVLGYLGEPMLRIGQEGVEVAAASPTAAGVGLLKGSRPTGGGRWRLRTLARSVAWHDARVRGLAPGITRGRWAIPLRLDGRPTRIEGRIWRVQAPSPLPWLALGAALVAVSALVLTARLKPLLRSAAAVLGTISVVAALIAAAGFALFSTASQGIWIEGANELIFALVGLAFVAWGSSDARGLAGGALGLLGLTVGLTRVPVLLHGVVLSALPALVARLAVVVAISAGVAAALVGLVVFFDVVKHYEEPRDAIT